MSLNLNFEKGSHAHETPDTNLIHIKKYSLLNKLSQLTSSLMICKFYIANYKERKDEKKKIDFVYATRAVLYRLTISHGILPICLLSSTCLV